MGDTRRETEAEGEEQSVEELENHSLNGRPLFSLRMKSPRSPSVWLSSGTAHIRGRNPGLETPPDSSFTGPFPLLAIRRALGGELPRKGTSPPSRIYGVTDSTAPEKESGNEILTT